MEHLVWECSCTIWAPHAVLLFTYCPYSNPACASVGWVPLLIGRNRPPRTLCPVSSVYSSCYFFFASQLTLLFVCKYGLLLGPWLFSIWDKQKNVPWTFVQHCHFTCMSDIITQDFSWTQENSRRLLSRCQINFTTANFLQTKENVNILQTSAYTFNFTFYWSKDTDFFFEQNEIFSCIKDSHPVFRSQTACVPVTASRGRPLPLDVLRNTRPWVGRQTVSQRVNPDVVVFLWPLLARTALTWVASQVRGVASRTGGALHKKFGNKSCHGDACFAFHCNSDCPPCVLHMCGRHELQPQHSPQTNCLNYVTNV